MKFLLPLILCFCGLSVTASAAADCDGGLSLNTKDLWPTKILENYELKADYFFTLQGIKLSTVTVGKPAQDMEYDFCEILVLSPQKVEMVCEPSDNKETSRFPESLRIVETINDAQPGSFKIFGVSKDLPEVELEGRIACNQP